MRLQIPKPSSRGANRRRVLAIARIAGLVLVFLLPMQMRAGASDPHPHALLQLLLDARDGMIDHHDGEIAPAHVGREDHGASSQPDVPATPSSNVVSGAVAILIALAATIVLPAARRVMAWPKPEPWCGWAPAVDPPPPRAGAV